MKKKFLAAFMVLTLSMSLMTGCGDKKDNGGAGDGGAAQNTPGAEVTKAPEEDGDIKFEIPQDIIDNMSPVIMNSVVKVTDEMCEKAILNKGNCERLAAVMEKAAMGGNVTIAYIGGSITAGSSASPQAEMCYEGLLRKWWTGTFPNAKFTFVNAGIGATDSYLGVHRLEEDVLKKKPDLIVVEFSVNDAGSNNAEPYESLIKRSLESDTKPAVISLIITMRDNYNKDHAVIAKNFNIPIINYAGVVQDNLKEGIWKWSDIGASDGTHPINEGHAVIARFMSYYYSKVLTEINTSTYKKYEMPKKLKTLSRYERGRIILADAMELVSADGFELVNISESIFSPKRGYKTTSAGSITFKVKGKCAGLYFWGTTDGKSGKFDVKVNDEPAITLNADFKGQWGSHADEVRLWIGDTEKECTVTITPAADNEGTELIILGFAVSD
ncbi:MAG: SGNH/GDSL hydrolase family protein [Clostridiales bacterium]|nr:SGNH/GDSL hydrolase family protein [Clostridiales bacterium]